MLIGLDRVDRWKPCRLAVSRAASSQAFAAGHDLASCDGRIEFVLAVLVAASESKLPPGVLAPFERAVELASTEPARFRIFAGCDFDNYWSTRPISQRSGVRTFESLVKSVTWTR